MKTGLTLEQLAAEITRQQNAKEDYVVNTGNLVLRATATIWRSMC